MQPDLFGHVLTKEEANQLSIAAGQILQPRTPITTRALFAGRWDVLTSVVDAVAELGLHVAIYGERGVGKSSLANVVFPTIRAFDEQFSPSESLPPPRVMVKANANSGESFSSIWERLFTEINWTESRPQVGFLPSSGEKLKTIREVFDLPQTLTVDDVRRILAIVPRSVFVVDEFDRAGGSTPRDFTDLIKCLADYAIDTTIILVGVSGTIDQLVADHGSINRALKHVHLPRMSFKDLQEILNKAEAYLKVRFSPDALNLIVHLSQGLPHYTHLIGLYAVRHVVSELLTVEISKEAVYAALEKAVRHAQQTVTSLHSNAIHSAHKDALHRQVLLACAFAAAASTDPLGYFSPGAVLEPLRSILSRTVEIATFNSHLREFCQARRANILERVGQPRTYRYRFSDPLLVPFVFMDGLSNQLITDEAVVKFLTRKT